jgi:hypothetical protein
MIACDTCDMWYHLDCLRLSYDLPSSTSRIVLSLLTCFDVIQTMVSSAFDAEANKTYECPTCAQKRLSVNI